MKKVIPIIIAVIILLLFISNNKKDYYIIPDESIRLRIIANSNSITDQFIKNTTKKQIESVLIEDISLNSSIDEVRTKIKNNLPKYESVIRDTFKNENYDKDFTISYGNNYFPEKKYKGVVYQEGMYESLYIEIGEAKGDNWWCCLFPPICSLEVSEAKDVEYRFFIKDIINKYLLKK